MGHSAPHAAELVTVDASHGEVYVEEISVEASGPNARVYLSVIVGSGAERRREIVGRLIVPLASLRRIAAALHEGQTVRACHKCEGIEAPNN